MQQRIVIDLGDDADQREVAEILADLTAMHFHHDPRLERSDGFGKFHTVELVPVEDLQQGDYLADFGRAFDRHEDGQNDQVVLVKFTDGLGYVESRGAQVAVKR